MEDKIRLSSRLLECAKMVDIGAKIADIGTDHAYIPIWLAQNEKISSALACDVRTGPLQNAEKNIQKYGVSSIVKIRLSNGLQNIAEHEAEEIIIAGLGGNIISKILDECNWKNKSEKIFILQPMKYEERLREYLAESGYRICSENAVICSGKVYTVIKSIFCGQKQLINDYQKYIGKLDENFQYPATAAYIKKQIKNLENHLRGAKSENLEKLEIYYYNVIENLKKFLI